MSTLSENAACIRETTSASTRTSQNKKKKSNFLASLLTLSHFTKTSKSIFWRPNNSARKNIWRKFKNLKFISSTTPDFQQVQRKMSSIAALLQAAEYLERRERGIQCVMIWSVKKFLSKNQSERDKIGRNCVKISKFSFHKKSPKKAKKAHNCVQTSFQFKHFDSFV